MPFTGGLSPSPERTGGGVAGSAYPSVQRIFESIAARRGNAFDQTTTSIVGAENLAYARSIDADLYGANVRFANEMNPVTSTVAGLLPRWEKIFGVFMRPGDTEPVRQQRVAAKVALLGQLNNSQGIIDALTNALGKLFVGLTLITPSEATTWWPGYGGTAAKVTAVSGTLVTVAGLTSVPTSAPNKNLVVSNANNAGNNGTFLVKNYISPTSVQILNLGSPVSPDYGVGGSSGSPTIVWSMPNPASPWTSTIEHLLVLVNPNAVPGYVNSDGTVNGAFYAAVNEVNVVLDLLAPADHTFDWYVDDSLGGIGFKLDEQNLDIEAMDS